MFDLENINKVISSWEMDIPLLTEQPTHTFNTDFPMIEETLLWYDRPRISVYQAGELYCLAFFMGYVDSDVIQQVDMVRTWEDESAFYADMKRVLNAEQCLYSTMIEGGKVGILISDNGCKRNIFLRPRAIYYQDIDTFPKEALPEPGVMLPEDDAPFQLDFTTGKYKKLTRAILGEPAAPEDDAFFNKWMAEEKEVETC